VITLHETAVFATTLVFVTVCILIDVRTMRIPNAVTFPGMIAGLALNAWSSGLGGVQASVAGFALATILLVGPFALGGVGAGDVKMMSAVGALLGPSLVLASLIAGISLGGVFAVVHLARIARLGEKLRALGRMLGNAALSRSFAPLKVYATSPQAVVLPYSLPLGLGTFAVIALAVVARA
jgi:prepilin peptidase CpaA